MKVYAEHGALPEHGALRHELTSLQERGLIELFIFPYENKNRNIPNMATPSAAQFGDLANVTFEQMVFPFDEMSGSNKYQAILDIVGQRNRRDALHIDSAYKTGCKAFFSRDRKNIIRNAGRLHQLLGIRFFHPDTDWPDFLAFVGDS
jgi:hypothetical protein